MRASNERMAEIGTTGASGTGAGTLRTASREAEQRRWWAGLVGSLAIVLAVALIGGALTMRGLIPEAALGGRSFYGWLIKPAWTPPSSLFGPVWAALYVTMAVAAWRVWRARTGRGDLKAWARARRRGLALYGLQLILNLAWSALFFAARRPGWALVNLLVLDLVVAATVVQFWRVRRVAGALMVPYLAWILFATALNTAIVVLNR